MYASMKAIDRKRPDDDVLWLTYWIVYISVLMGESLGFVFLQVSNVVLSNRRLVSHFFFNSLHLSLSLMEDREEDTEASKSSSCFRSERSFVGGSRASIDR